MITEEFKKRFTEYVTELENTRLKIYDDGFGNPTIGIGFILINQIGKEWKAYPEKELQKLGIHLTAKQYKIIEDYAEAKSEGNDTSNLKDQLKKLDFTITPDISQKLLMYSIEDKYKIIKTRIGEECWNKLNLARQIGVMDHAFHKGDIKPLTDSLTAGNYNETAQIMKDIIKIPSLKARAELRADFVQYGKMDFEGIYIIRSGDNLTKIARSHCLKLDELEKLNPEVSKLKALPVGQKINIPPTVKTIPLIDIDDEGNKLFKFEIVHNKCKISEDNIAGETKEILLSAGPFFVRLKANNQVTNIGQCSKDSSLFLSKTLLNTPTENSIIDLFKSTQGVTEGSIHTKTLNLTKEQYNKILQYIESGIKYGDTKVLQSQTSANETSNNVEQHYIVKADDSASLVQNLYHATGLPLYFTAAYSKPELVNLESVDAKKALEAYSSRDDIIKKLNSIYGDSKEEIAKMLNLDSEQVSRASKLKGCIPTCRAVEGTKFRVKIDQEMLDSITSIIDVSDNKSIQTRDVLDINNMCKELNELFLRFKIPPEISQDDSSSKPSTSSVKSDNEFANQDSNYGNFQKLKDYIKEEMLKDKGKLDKLLQTVDKQEQSTSSGNHYTEQELISIYHKQIEVLQKEFKNTHEYYQKNPGQYKYEPGEKLPGSAAFNRGEIKLSQWLSEELSKIKGIAVNIPVSQRNTSQEIKEKIVQDWNKTIDSLRGKTEFNDKVNESINKIDQTVAIITHDMELLLQGEESVIAQGIFC